VPPEHKVRGSNPPGRAIFPLNLTICRDLNLRVWLGFT
jgi:hypothetical protein